MHTKHIEVYATKVGWDLRPVLKFYYCHDNSGLNNKTATLANLALARTVVYDRKLFIVHASVACTINVL